MRSFLLAVLVAAFISFSATAQHQKVEITDAEQKLEGSIYPSSIQVTPLSGIITPGSGGPKWATSVRRIEGSKHKAPNEWDTKTKVYDDPVRSEPSKKTNVDDPVVGTNYEANWTINQTPTDNTIAISNGGYVVTANNDGIEVYNSANQLAYFDFWTDFVNDPTLTGTLYDPKVVYDSESDRFVLVLLHSSDPSTSRVLVCFSQTNNPTQGWWVYQLNGNVLNNGTWFDYPNVGVSNSDVFVSGNLYDSNDDFDQSIVFQIPKSEGYSGASLNWVYWNNYGTTPFPGFTLMPAAYGQQGTYGPGMFFVSTRPGGASAIRLYEITNNTLNNPQMNFYSAATTPYSPGVDADQLGSTDVLDCRDNRLQNAFYLNGVIHFAFHSDIGNGWNGINYNRMQVSTLTNFSGTFGLQGSFDYVYPTVASFATDPSDQTAMIIFLRSGSSIYPETRVVKCDHGFNWSNSVEVKAGETFVNFQTSTEERWGDYIGIARKHNSPVQRVWVAGCYGANVTGQRNNTWKTWVAEIVGDGTSTSVEEIENETITKVYPNPSYDFINVEFEAQDESEISIEILDMEGRLVKLLYKDRPKQGLNRLAFNRGALASGNYILNIQSNQGPIHHEQIIVLD